MKIIFNTPEISIALFDKISCADISGTGGGADSSTNLGQAESTLSGYVTKQYISVLEFK